MYKGFSRSVMGASHEKKGIVCQDSSAFKVSEHYAVAVVADGHGSKKHFRSNIGSQAAVDATLETIERFYENPEEFEKNFPKYHDMIIRNIEKQIISNWNWRIMKHLEENPVTVVEKKPFTNEEFEAISPESYYGSTLIVAVAGKNFTFGVQIGDGSLVTVFDDGTTIMPMDYEEANPANITASICNNMAATMFDSFYIENKKLVAAYASTDGLYTSFGSDNDFRDYHTIITSQLADFGVFEQAVIKNLEKRSHYGTEDDVSLSCVYDVEALEANIENLKNKVAENKQAAIDRKAALLNNKNV